MLREFPMKKKWKDYLEDHTSHKYMHRISWRGFDAVRVAVYIYIYISMYVALTIVISGVVYVILYCKV